MNWSVYNDSLVRRGEILLDFTILEGWDREVRRMNASRRGRPFTYPDSLIRLLASIRLLFHLPYRQLEGFTRGLWLRTTRRWIRRRFKVRKGYLKVHIAVNVKTKQIVALEVTGECIHDGTRLEGL